MNVALIKGKTLVAKTLSYWQFQNFSDSLIIVVLRYNLIRHLAITQSGNYVTVSGKVTLYQQEQINLDEFVSRAHQCTNFQFRLYEACIFYAWMPL